MSLIKCPECNKQVSTFAENCPECGCPIRDYEKYKNIAEKKEKLNFFQDKEFIVICRLNEIIKTFNLNKDDERVDDKLIKDAEKVKEAIHEKIRDRNRWNVAKNVFKQKTAEDYGEKYTPIKVINWDDLKQEIKEWEQKFSSDNMTVNQAIGLYEKIVEHYLIELAGSIGPAVTLPSSIKENEDKYYLSLWP